MDIDLTPKKPHRIAVLTHSPRLFISVFLDLVQPQDRDKFKAVTCVDDLRGERFLNYITLWDFGKMRGDDEIEDIIKTRLLS